MAFNLQRPYYGTFYNAATNSTNIYSSTRGDSNIDTRSPLVRTPRGRWRPPTSYSRSVDTGYVYCFDLKANKSFRQSGQPSTKLAKAVSSGAVDSSGYYYDAVPSFPSSLTDRAAYKALNNLKNQHVNLAQAYGERAQTARLVGDSIHRIVDVVKGVKRLDPRRVRSALRASKAALARMRAGMGDSFNYFLEYEYGWKPALSDAYGVMEALHEREKEADRGLVTVKGSASQNDHTIVHKPNGAIGAIQISYDKRRDIEQKCYVRMDFIPSNAPMTGTLAQLGITNPLELAWELTPWSFVADWFIPLGDYFAILDATNGWNFKGGSVSKKTTVTSHPVNGSIVWDTAYELTPRSGYASVSGVGHQMRFTRTALGSPLFPERPHLKKSASAAHVANGIALLMSTILGGSRVR